LKESITENWSYCFEDEEGLPENGSYCFEEVVGPLRLRQIVVSKIH
jgi:hypothetical protein